MQEEPGSGCAGPHNLAVFPFLTNWKALGLTLRCPKVEREEESVTRKLLVGVALLALMGLVLGSFWVASASPDNDRRRVTFTRVLNLNEVEFQEIDEAPQGVSLGDQFIFSGTLLSRSETKERGRADGYCTITSNPAGPEEIRQLCVITATGLPVGDAPGAELEMQGVGRELAEDTDLGITGGTGVFKKARGSAIFDFTTADRAIITFHVIL